jgi:poly-beta-hydroxyalkanoate depolymerase
MVQSDLRLEHWKASNIEGIEMERILVENGLGHFGVINRRRFSNFYSSS